MKTDWTRRTLCISLLGTLIVPPAIAAAPMRFVFRIQTKDGGIIGNVTIEAPDQEAAKVKLMKRYPGCTILNVKST